MHANVLICFPSVVLLILVRRRAQAATAPARRSSQGHKLSSAFDDRSPTPPQHQPVFIDMCWAIVAAEAIAAGLKAKNPDKDLPELSSQELLDCCKEEEKQCYTYSIIKALKWIKSYGILKEEQYPFKADKCPCRDKTEEQKTLAVKIIDIKKVDHDNENELLMRLKEQPIACSLIVTNAFRKLEGGIYEGSDELDLILQGKERTYQHAILLIGFGHDEKEDKNYWIIKNSYGKYWGVHGYGRIARESSFPKGMPNLISRTCYPIVPK